jgi:hypothetical protein
MWEIGEAILWFLLSIVITTAGVLAALFAMLIYYFRGTRAGGFAMTCVIFSVLAAAVLWVIFVRGSPGRDDLCCRDVDCSIHVVRVVAGAV